MAAKAAANNAYALAFQLEQLGTLPAFIYATSSLYDPKPDTDTILGYFSYALTNEQDTPLLQWLFAIFSDRAMYRIDDGGVDARILEQLYDLSRVFPHDKRKAVVQAGLVARYFIRIKVEQQKISSLYRSNSKTIRDDPRTLDVVKQSLGFYKTLLATSSQLIEEQTNILLEKEKERWHVPAWEIEWLEKTRDAHQLWQPYSAGTTALEGMVRELEVYQQSLTQEQRSGSIDDIVESDVEGSDLFVWFIGFALIGMCAILVRILRRQRTR